MDVYQSESSQYIAGRGLVLVVRILRDYENFSSLVGTEVLIDDLLFNIRGVEYFDRGRTHKAGESVGLLVTKKSRVS